MKNLEITQDLITPRRAAELLGGNTLNRKIRKPTVDLYAEQMRTGEWNEYTGIPIILTPDGTLIDGQHRLMAVIASGCSVKFVINRNGTEVSKNYIDIGYKRTAANILEMTGVANSTNIAAGLKGYVKLCNGQIAVSDSGRCANHAGNKSIKTSLELSNNSLEELYYKNPDRWQELYKKSHKYYTAFHRMLNLSFVFSLCGILDDVDNELSEMFCDKLFNSIRLTLDDPEYHLRSIIISNHNSDKKYSQKYMWNCIATTWNIRYDDEICNSSNKIIRRVNKANGTVKLNGYDYGSRQLKINSLSH